MSIHAAKTSHINVPLTCIFTAGLLCGAILFKVGQHYSTVEVNNTSLLHNITKEDFEESNKLIVQNLRSQHRILCWVMTHPNNHESKARVVKETWARFCDKTLYFTNGAADASFPIIHVDAIPGRLGLWPKVRKAFAYIHKNFQGQYDWVMKADDDTYVNVDSLRQLLVSYDPSEALFVGEQLNVEQLYMGGGGGYVLSRTALDKFVQIQNDSKSDEQVGCDRRSNLEGEDPAMGICMRSLKVAFIDARDSLGINRFSQHPGPSREQLWSLKTFWYWNYQMHTSTKKDEASLGCCSSVYISYHYITPVMMHLFQYLTKKVNPVDTSLLLWTDKERDEKQLIL